MNSFTFLTEILIALKQEAIRYRVAVAAVFAVVLLGIIAVGANWQNTYVSTVVVSVDDTNLIQPLLAGRAAVTEVDTSAIAQEKIYSRQLLDEVAKRLGYVDEHTTEADLSNLASHLRRGIILERGARNTNSFAVSFFDSNPDRSFQTVKVLIEEFIEYHESSKREEGVYAFDFISKQVALYKSRLEKVEQKIKDFKASSIDLSEGAVQSRILELDGEIQELKLSIEEDRSRIYNIDAQLSSESDYLEKQSKAFSIQSQKSALEDQLRSLRMQYQESYPDIVLVKQQIGELDAQLARIGVFDVYRSSDFGSGTGVESDPETLFRDLRRQKSQANVDLNTKQQRLKSLEALLIQEQQKADIVATNQAELSDLRRDYDVTKDVYEEMLSRKENAELSMAITQDGQGISYKVVTDAVYPLYPTGLTFKYFALAAPVLAVGIPLAILLALVMLDPRIRTISNIYPVLTERVGLLGVVPHYHSAISERLLRKDMFVLACFMFSVTVIYLYISISNLLSS